MKGWGEVSERLVPSFLSVKPEALAPYHLPPEAAPTMISNSPSKGDEDEACV